MSRIRFDRVSKTYGDVVALDEFELEVREGEFLALLGPSGCGKTTALRLVAGFLKPTTRRILIDDMDVSVLPPHRRNLGMVFQDYALFPHMTVADNIAFGLHERGQKGSQAARRVDELLALVKLPGMQGRYPGELSGGQQQRVALARALAFRPSVLLMDEPFGALDLKLREAMQSELVQIQRQLRITTLFVTHDQGEAIAMSDRIAVMNNGRIEQLGSPEEIYHRPSNQFVAAFVGKINLIEAQIIEARDDGLVVGAAGTIIQALPAPWAQAGMTSYVAVRPESFVITFSAAGDETSSHTNALEGTVVGRRFAGSSLAIEIETGDRNRLQVETRGDEVRAQEGARVILRWPADKTIVLRK